MRLAHDNSNQRLPFEWSCCHKILCWPFFWKIPWSFRLSCKWTWTSSFQGSNRGCRSLQVETLKGFFQRIEVWGLADRIPIPEKVRIFNIQFLVVSTPVKELFTSSLVFLSFSIPSSDRRLAFLDGCEEKLWSGGVDIAQRLPWKDGHEWIIDLAWWKARTALHVSLSHGEWKACIWPIPGSSWLWLEVHSRQEKWGLAMDCKS